MTLKMIEGFNNLGLTPEKKFSVRHTGYGNIVADEIGGRGQVLKMGNQPIHIPLDTYLTSGVIGFAVKFMDQPTGSSSFCQVYSGPYACLRLNLTKYGGLVVLNSLNNSIAVLDIKTDFYIWHYFEIKINAISDSSSPADVIIKMNGVVIYECEAGEDFMYGVEPYFDCLHLEFSELAGAYFDAIYFCDLAGAKNNDYLGDMVVEQITPDGNGNSSNFLGSDADSTDNYLHVDETDPNDSDYIASSTPTDLDLFTFANLTGTPTLVHSVQTQARVVLNNPGLRTGKIVTRVDGTNYEGDVFYAGIGHLHFQHLWEDNPDDAAAWEIADISNAEFGVKVES